MLIYVHQAFRAADESRRLNHIRSFQNITDRRSREKIKSFYEYYPLSPGSPRTITPWNAVSTKSTRPDGHGDCHWWGSGFVTHCTRNPRVPEQELTSRLWGGALIRKSFSEREFCGLRLWWGEYHVMDGWIWHNWEVILWWFRSLGFILSRGYDALRCSRCLTLCRSHSRCPRFTWRDSEERVRAEHAGLIEPSNCWIVMLVT